MVTGVKKVVPISAMIGTLLLTPVSWASTAPVTHLTEADAKVENLKAFSESPESTEAQAAEPVAGVNALPLSDVADSIRREVPAATPLLYTDTLTNIYAEHQLKPLWTDEKARLSLENQLAEAALAGFPAAVHGLAECPGTTGSVPAGAGYDFNGCGIGLSLLPRQREHQRR